MTGKRLLVMLVALMLVAAACGSDGDESAETTTSGSDTTSDTTADTSSVEPTVIKVGVPLDMSGPAAISNIGLSELNGMQLALAEIESQGILGDFSIELITIDTKADKQEAVAAVLKLVDDDDVDAIVGFTLTPSFLAAAPQAVSAGIPIVTVGLAGATVTDQGDNVVRMLPNVVGLYTKSDAQFADAFGSTSAAYLYTSDSETTAGIHNARKAGLEAAGVSTASEQAMGTEDTDYRAQLTEMANSGADLIVITAFPGQFAGIYLQAEELGIDTQVISSDGTARDEVLDQAGEAMQCVVFNAIWAEQTDTDRNASFAAGIRAEYDDEPDLYYAAGYDAMWVFATALAEAGSADAEALVAALGAHGEFEGAFGVYSYDANREPSIGGTNLVVTNGVAELWSADTPCVG